MNVIHTQAQLTVQHQADDTKNSYFFGFFKCILSKMGGMTLYTDVKCLTRQSIFSPYVYLQTNLLVGA